MQSDGGSHGYPDRDQLLVDPVRGCPRVPTHRAARLAVVNSAAVPRTSASPWPACVGSEHAQVPASPGAGCGRRPVRAGARPGGSRHGRAARTWPRLRTAALGCSSRAAAADSSRSRTADTSSGSVSWMITGTFVGSCRCSPKISAKSSPGVPASRSVQVTVSLACMQMVWAPSRVNASRSTSDRWAGSRPATRLAGSRMKPMCLARSPRSSSSRTASSVPRTMLPARVQRPGGPRRSRRR